MSISNSCTCFFKKMLLFFVLSFEPLIGFSSDQRDDLDAEHARFLQVVADAEADSWLEILETLNHDFPMLMKESSTGKALSSLNARILKSDDLKLIRLFQRAVRNHDSLSAEKADPFTFHYKHYQPPSFLIPSIHLTFDIKEGQVIVTSDLTVARNSKEASLILDGREHKVCEVSINGTVLSKNAYHKTPHELILLDIPETESFKVCIRSEINPFSNKTLEGMYQCREWLTTQCESEGARRIFFTLDRPDVLSQITTTIIADKERYPYRLSNGDCVEEVLQDDGRWSITWHDPFPKPSYLFACVLGRFSQLTSQFTTKSGRNVDLEIYVEPGKESRAHYALFALKKAMEFDEVLFDREYDLSNLKMVGIPDFNSGAMENKGLMIFNDVRLLVDAQSGTDRTHREVAAVVGHEYFHNWSGNRVTIRNWFEIALKEAFTDLRAMLFSEWLFGSGFIRPKAVLALRENQFPEETSEKGHPIIVESYVDAHSIYDATTYTKGREVFRTLKNYIDMLVPGGFREVQNLYFSRYDGQAVTFRELLEAANEVLKSIGKDLTKFERWFHQQGTPVVKAKLIYDEEKKMVEITLAQSCRHPKTGLLQEPLIIPFSLELLAMNGEIIHPKFASVLENESTSFAFASSSKPTPIFMHGCTAPVILEYDYSADDLACIIKHSDDPFSRWEAIQKYSILSLRELSVRIEQDPSLELMGENGHQVLTDHYELYKEAMKSHKLSPLAKAQLLEIPSIRTLAQALNCYDFDQLNRLRQLFIHQLALTCKPSLEDLLKDHSVIPVYDPNPGDMQIRELRHGILTLLSRIDDKYKEVIFEQYQQAGNFEDKVSAFNLCLKMGNPYRSLAIDDFYHHWKEDKAVFNFWLSSQSSSENCTVEDLRRLESAEGYDSKNPNHVRSILRSFISNLKCYHDPSGEGYRYIVDRIIQIAKFNPFLAHNYIAVPAFLDYEKIPAKQQVLMAQELERLLRHDGIPAQTRDLVERILGLR